MGGGSLSMSLPAPFKPMSLLLSLFPVVDVNVKSEIGQFAGGAKNLQDQCVVVIYLQKICQYD